MPVAQVTNNPANYIAVGKQAAKDTEAASFYFAKQLNGSGFQLTWNVTGEREGGSGQEVTLRYKDKIKGDGAINCNARYGWAARSLAWILGSDTVASQAAGSTSVQAHTQVLVGSAPYLTIEQRYADEIERADNCMLTTLSIEGQAGKPLKFNANFMVGGTIYQRDVSSALTPVRETSRPFFYPYGSYTFDGFASYSNKVTKFKIEIQRHVDDSIQTTGLNNEDVTPLNFDASLDATIVYETRDFYQKIAYTGGSQVSPDFATGSFQLNVLTPGAAILGPYNPGIATGYLLNITMPFLQYVDGKVNKLDPDGKTMYLDLVMNTLGGVIASSSIFSTVYTDDATSY